MRQFQLLTFPHYVFFNNIHVKLAIHFSLEEKIAKNYLYLSKLAAQMVTSTPSKNISLHLSESQNKNFNVGTLKTLISHSRSIFFKEGHPTKIWRKKIFFMKTLSKLGALTVYKCEIKPYSCCKAIDARARRRRTPPQPPESGRTWSSSTPHLFTQRIKK